MAFVHNAPFEDGKTTPYILSDECTTALGSFLNMVKTSIAMELTQAFHDARIIHKDDLARLMTRSSGSTQPEAKPEAKPETTPTVKPLVKPLVKKSEPAEKAPKNGKVICKALKKDGKPCTAAAKPGSDFCGIHQGAQS